jgi:hypothetical protein
MTHWDYTEEIKRRSHKAGRRVAKVLEREARQARECSAVIFVSGADALLQIAHLLLVANRASQVSECFFVCPTLFLRLA